MLLRNIKRKCNVNPYIQPGAQLCENERHWSQLTDDEKVDIIAQRILQKYNEGSKELAK